MSEFITPMILGVGIFGFLMLYLSTFLDEEKHWMLKLIIYFFVVSILLLIPKSLIDAQTQCESVVSNSTDVSSVVTRYEYERFCYTRDENTGLSFLQNAQRMYWLLIGYVIVMIGIWAIQSMMASYKARRRR